MIPVSAEELSQVIRRSRPASAPPPFDCILYTILKKCPSLHPALLDFFNRVIMEGSIPSAWKVAAVKLIPKSSAEDEPSLPANFRPIALTPAISKLFSGILKDRWMRHMKYNGFLNTDPQKPFLPTIPGVAEHQAKLAAIISSARRDKSSLSSGWSVSYSPWQPGLSRDGQASQDHQTLLFFFFQRPCTPFTGQPVQEDVDNQNDSAPHFS